MTVYNPDLGVCLPTEEPNRRILIAPVLHFVRHPGSWLICFTPQAGPHR